MSTFAQHTLDTAPSAARPLLESAQKKLGFIPNLYANLAEAPAALEAYFELSAQLDKTSLSPTERQVVMLAASAVNGCEFCVAAHSMIARNMVHVPSPVVDALRAQTSLPDARLNALAAFTRKIVIDRGWVKRTDLDTFLAAGYTRQQAIEVVLGVAMKTLSNYANHLMGTQTNSQFISEAWVRTA